MTATARYEDAPDPAAAGPLDWGQRMQQAAERHFDGLDEALWGEPDDGAEADPCGCLTCHIRETLAGAWPVIQALVAHEVAQAVARAAQPPTPRRRG